ncbi:MAG: aminodeoxychorismate synthase component I [Betaproteobacteria bacterium]|nr:aminodeoxychorismate synthase component I [Betaproteobacteria bacterium]
MALDYELGYLLEPRSAPADWAPGQTVVARFWRFQERRALFGAEAEDWLAGKVAGQPAGVGDICPSIDETSYRAAVGRIKQFISDGDCYQVNFTFPIEFSWFGSPLALYARLRQRQPVRYGGFVGDRQGGVVSLSPELFLERQGERLLTRPMKGTAARSEPSDTLRDSLKDRAENLMIVDLLRNDLGRLAETGSVKVERLFAIEAYPTVWQMVSEVSARIGRQDFSSVLRALFPCGSITGAPKIRAMQIIGELEHVPRHLYTGALGWLAPDGDFRLNVAIRTLELARDHRGKMGVGSGVVADSQPGGEWRECLLKAEFIRAGDPGLKLIETLRRENGTYPMWHGHLERLRRSAAWFGFPLDEQKVCSQLGLQPSKGIWRVRLTLDRAGEVEIQAVEMTDALPSARLAVLADAWIDSSDPLRGHKTTARQHYDAALRSLPADSPVFDVIFLNERGELAEGARSNIFVERDGVLLTPPQHSGALPGVLRAELLASGRAREGVLHPADLNGGFWLGNALRGLIPVRLLSTK